MGDEWRLKVCCKHCTKEGLILVAPLSPGTCFSRGVSRGGTPHLPLGAGGDSFLEKATSEKALKPFPSDEGREGVPGRGISLCKAQGYGRKGRRAPRQWRVRVEVRVMSLGR